MNTAPQHIGEDLTPSPSRPRRRNKWNTLGIAFSLVAPVAVRAAQNYALQHLERVADGPIRCRPPKTGRRHSSESGVTGQAVPLGPAVRFRDSH